MKKIMKKVTAVGLCAVLCLSGTRAAFAQTTEEDEKTKPAETGVTEQSVSKEETVYVLAGADGAAQRVIVSDWLCNTSESDVILDESGLSGIENVKSDAGYTEEGEGVLRWDARGEDIYYQGESEKTLPLEMTVSYTLDGRSVSAAELAGKSGRVSIRFDYRSLSYETAEIGGETGKIYVPFAVLTGMVLDNEVFRNVEVTNGRAINDGERTLAVGLAVTGLRENLGLEENTPEIPEYVEICADVTDFELGMTLSVASSEIFRELNADSADTGTLAALEELTQAVTRMTDGSAALYDGLSTLLEQTDSLASGATQLAEGAASLSRGADTLNSGAAQLQSGAAELSTGLSTLSGSSDTLREGAAQVFETLLSAASEQLAAVGTVPALTAENYAAVLEGTAAQLESAGAAQSAQTVLALKASLDSYNSFYQGLRDYTSGVDAASVGAQSLVSGAATLKDGAGQLKTGADTLYSGAKTMRDGMPSLIDGVTELRDGAGELAEGIGQLSGQVVQRLTSLLGEEPERFAERLKATGEAAENYRSFAGIRDDMAGQVKFVYRTEEIRAEEK